MEIRQLVALVTVAEVGSVTRAAELLNHVQPAISRQIRLLEEELGVLLFERTPRGMVLTEPGEQLVERVRRALNELERARTEIGLDSDEVTGTATVGILESLSSLIVEPLVSRVRQRFPAVDLRILTGFSGNLQKWLDDGELDMSILYNMASSPSLSVFPLMQERLWVVAPPEAGLTPENPVDWPTVTRHPLILPVPGHGLRDLLSMAHPELNLTATIAVETNSMYVQKELVRSGEGWTLLFAAGVAENVANGVFSGAPVHRPEVTRTVMLALQRRQGQSRAVRAVARELNRLVQHRVGTGRWKWVSPLPTHTGANVDGS